MPQRAIEQLRRQIADGYSYLDVLAVSVATTGLRSFTSDHSQWVSTLRDLRDDYPQLLSGMWFSERGYSEQLEEFFGVMRRAGAMTTPSTGYGHLLISAAAAAEILAAAPYTLLHEHGDDVRAIASAIEALGE